MTTPCSSQVPASMMAKNIPHRNGCKVFPHLPARAQTSERGRPLVLLIQSAAGVFKDLRPAQRASGWIAAERLQDSSKWMHRLSFHDELLRPRCHPMASAAVLADVCNRGPPSLRVLEGLHAQTRLIRHKRERKVSKNVRDAGALPARPAGYSHIQAD